MKSLIHLSETNRELLIGIVNRSIKSLVLKNSTWKGELEFCLQELKNNIPEENIPDELKPDIEKLFQK